MENIKQRVIVLSAQQFDMDTEQGHMDGTSVRYLMGDKLETYREEGMIGMKLAKARLSLNAFNDFVSAPAIYETEIAININGSGKVSMNAVNFKYICEIDGEVKGKK